MKNFSKIIISILTIILITLTMVSLSACGEESKNEDVATIDEVATTVVPTTIAPTTAVPTTIKPTEKPTEEEVIVEQSSKEAEDNKNNEEDEGGIQDDDVSNDNNDDTDIDNDNSKFNNIVSSEAIYSPGEFQNAGVINWGGYQWTYYSELILPGYGLNIPGRHTTSDGYVCDGDGYVVLAADLSMLSRGSIVETPFGYTGKVYDTGCAYGVLDVYVGW